ncbi:XVIPCD domain-containing protein [Lysobacter firmicutimachus]|uniref:XVIPCD domain-containing protein n=1 Tax=Lysobacter firmicutimachus TaxID=1792846 RepID=A0ABU8D1S8_9GAMM
MFPSVEALKERQALLKQLRESGDPAAVARADELQRTYHADNMAVLAKDTYLSAMEPRAPDERTQPPPGWIRASEHLDKLREAAPALSALSNEQLLDYLKPGDSGFRAEIYLPDPTILGPGYKPVIVPKGSAGEVMGKDGKLYGTTNEDFIANNFPQSVGLKTDYYDRAMLLATQMQINGLVAEYSGHSLGGGMASAMSAVTGNPATTWNAAGLHPETARRFARENPGTQVHDTSRSVVSYQIKGELLNDGVQHNIDRLDALHRAQLAGVLRETCKLLQDVPEGREVLTTQLSAMLPRHAQPSVREFVKTLAEGDTNQLLRDLPLAAGRIAPLDDVKVWENGSLADREQRLTLTEISNFAAPVLETAYITAQGARVGRVAGQATAAAGDMAAANLDASGDLVRTATAKAADFADVVSGVQHSAVQAGVRLTGEGVAQARVAAGRVEAAIDTVQGEVQLRGAQAGAGLLRGIGDLDVLPDSMQRWANDAAANVERGGQAAHARNRAEAAQARSEAQSDASGIRQATSDRVVDLERVQVVVEGSQRAVIAGSGQQADFALDSGSRALGEVARHAPVMGAGIGAAAGGVAGIQANTNLVDLVQIGRFAHGYHTQGAEGIERHLMTEAVLPSMASRVQAEERAIRAEFPNLNRPAHSAPEQKPASGPDQPAHPDHSMLEQIRQGMRAADARIGKPYDEGSERISRCLLAACKDNREMHPGRDYSLAANALSRVDHVVPGPTGNMFAVEGKLDDPASKRACVSVEQALKTPVEQSDQKLALANQAIAQEQERERSLTQNQQRNGPSLG